MFPKLSLFFIILALLCMGACDKTKSNPDTNNNNNNNNNPPTPIGVKEIHFGLKYAVLWLEDNTITGWGTVYEDVANKLYPFSEALKNMTFNDGTDVNTADLNGKKVNSVSATMNRFCILTGEEISTKSGSKLPVNTVLCGGDPDFIDINETGNSIVATAVKVAEQSTAIINVNNKAQFFHNSLNMSKKASCLDNGKRNLCDYDAVNLAGPLFFNSETFCATVKESTSVKDSALADVNVQAGTILCSGTSIATDENGSVIPLGFVKGEVVRAFGISGLPQFDSAGNFKKNYGATFYAKQDGSLVINGVGFGAKAIDPTLAYNSTTNAMDLPLGPVSFVAGSLTTTHILVISEGKVRLLDSQVVAVEAIQKFKNDESYVYVAIIYTEKGHAIGAVSDKGVVQIVTDDDADEILKIPADVKQRVKFKS